MAHITDRLRIALYLSYFTKLIGVSEVNAATKIINNPLKINSKASLFLFLT